ncbi:hypothetical protein N7519_011008 [Penicillium mononematosum]|uniref:uncharacterized protein n=1 Tax=Penicillium mononematosum TaxID=268346 RepID=UPI002546EEB2|nr:uncharacterized protein N7519_011008 [Penicillium mononematosum]KAJ6180547.1 hypothetical protein N7519_011008 [Penicillium mononematosum]
MSSPAAPKDKIFPGISATETKLLVLANVCLKNDKIDYDKLASSAGIKASSAQTLFRNAKRKLDKLYADGNVDAGGNGPQADISPEETPSKRGKSSTKAPQAPRTPKTPKSPKVPKTPKAPKTPKTPKGSKAAVDPDYSPTTKSASKITKDGGRATAVTEPAGTATGSVAAPTAEPVIKPAAKPAATTEATKPHNAKEEGNGKADENNEAEATLDLAVNQHLPESPLPDEEDGAYEEEVQEDDQSED